MSTTDKKNPQNTQSYLASSGRDNAPERCSALTTSGNRCKRFPTPGLTVCQSHGGGTQTSKKKSKNLRVAQKVNTLWGLSTDNGNVDVIEELNKLARNKLTDITALRIELGKNPDKYHGMLEFSEEETSSDSQGTSERLTRKLGTHPLVDELHKAEGELVQILKLLREVTGDTSTDDLVRVRMQTAREAARLLKSYPGMGADEVAQEVAKRV